MAKDKECIHGCGRNATAETDECKPCRGGFYYWNKKSPTDRMKRRDKLDVLSSRLDTHFNTRGRPNEEPLVQPKPKTSGNKVIVLRERRRA